MRRAVVVVTTLLALVAGGQAVAEEDGGESTGAEGITTLQGQNSEWDVVDDGDTCIDNFDDVGLAVEDANLVAPSHFDAYDDAFMIFVDGVPYAPPGTSFGTTAVDGDPQGLSGLQVKSSYRTFSDRDILRQLSTFTNVDESPKSVTVGWAADIGADGGTVQEATSDGDTTVEASDLWFVVSDGGGPSPDPRLSFVIAGVDDPTTTSTPQQAAEVPSACLLFPDDFGFLYELTVPAQASCSLLHFGELTPGDVPTPIPSPEDPEEAAATVAGESILSAADSADALSTITASSPVVADLDPAVLAGVVNFDLGERAGGTCVGPDVVPDDDEPEPEPGPVPATPSFTG